VRWRSERLLERSIRTGATVDIGAPIFENRRHPTSAFSSIRYLGW
jgi:hypothetical protein